MNDLTLYEKVRDQIQTGDHIGYKGRHLLGRIIRRFSGGTINHSELAVRLDYQGLQDRRFTLAALNKGIEFHLLSKTLLGYKGEAFWWKLKPEFDAFRPYIASWAFKQLDTPYDYKSLFRNALGHVSSDMAKLFCSEYYNYALSIVGVDTGWPIVGKAPQPADIEHFKIFEPPIRIL